ncbi:unnamed protein product [Oppiella nova]|uniref:RBR-type E3 ubiquitin transferase n=1 Tax=Oppiella nova TaxID=334625 RepID=A0A7R9LZS5_9ACAR|nr:unnamed protein product [Oppiella nova]CAG2168534.1 unnamed protein product [Oppiella nova]
MFAILFNMSDDEQDNFFEANTLDVPNTPPVPRGRTTPPDTTHSDGDEESEHGQFTCPICIETYTLDKLEDFGCGHLFCTGCVKAYLTVGIREGDVLDIECMDQDCHVIVTQELVQNILDDDVLYKRYQYLLLKVAVEDIPYVYYCPTPTCTGITEAEVDHAACSECGLAYHERTDCDLDDDERRNLIQLNDDKDYVESIVSEDELNRRAIEALVEEDRQWLETISREQAAIRRAEQLFEEQRRADEERRAEEERRVREQREREERERREREIVAEQEAERLRLERERQEERRKQDESSEQTIRITSKPCPGCRRPIELT